MSIQELFAGPSVDARLSWMNPPQKWSLEDSRLIVEPSAKSDFWQKTHYGFQVDNGHLLYAEVAQDFTMTTKVRFNPVHQYDQAGLMVYLSPHCWIKTSVEYEPDEPNRLGAVVTNHGYSDWSTQDFPDSVNEVDFRVRRKGNDYIVEYSQNGGEQEEAHHWIQIRMAHLHEEDEGGTVKCGLYACSPIGEGYSAAFDFLKIVTEP